MNTEYKYSEQFTKVFAIGDTFIVHGWLMLKGVDAGEYAVVNSDDSGVWMRRVLKSRKLSKKKVGHLRSDLFGSLNCYLRGDLNGIQLTKASQVEIIKKVKQN